MQEVTRKKKILIAEDDNGNFLLLQILLKKDYELFRAYNGKEAWEQFQSIAPDIVLMDIKMPELDGLDTTYLIRQVSPKTPILALSAYAFNEDKLNALWAGCNAYITKPLNLRELKEIIETYL